MLVWAYNSDIGGFMKVLRKYPHKSAEVVSIENTLSALQAEVGGDIQMITPFDHPYGVICNEMGKSLGLQPNLGLIHKDKLADILVGTILFVRLGDEDYVDLTDDDITYITRMIDDKNRLCVCGTDVIPTLQYA